MPSAEHAKINKTSILHAEGMWSSWRVHTTYKPIIIRQCDMNQEKKKDYVKYWGSTARTWEIYRGYAFARGMKVQNRKTLRSLGSWNTC